jgi:glycerophosphoryl diester phosphodiesterase
MAGTATPFRWHPNGQPTIIGHRGFGSTGFGTGYRENTKSALLAAITAGAEWVEVDVQMACNNLVLHHNLHVSGGTPVARLTADQCSEHGIELLAAATAQISDGIGINLELKTTPADATHNDLIGAVLRHIAQQPARRWMITSFDPSVPLGVREQAEQLEMAAPATGWAVERGWPYGKAVLSAIRLGCQAVMLHPENVLADPSTKSDAPTLEETLELVESHRLAVAAWDATPANAAALVSRGVTGLCTDEVAQLEAALDRGLAGANTSR